MSSPEQSINGQTSENNAAAGNSRSAEDSTIASQPGTKRNAQYRLNRLSLKRKLGSHADTRSHEPLTSAATSLLAPLPDSADTAVADRLELPAHALAESSSLAAALGGEDMSRRGEAAISSVRVTGPIPSGRPGISARFKPPGQLVQATGYGGDLGPPPGWKPRKKDYASFDMLDDLPDFAALAPLGDPGVACAPAAATNSAAEDADTGPAAGSQPEPAKKRQWKCFVPPRPLERFLSAARGEASEAGTALKAGTARAAYGKTLQSSLVEAHSSRDRDSSERGGAPDGLGESLPESSSDDRQDPDMDRSGTAPDRALAMDESSGGQGAFLAACDPYFSAQQERQRSADRDRSRMHGSAVNFNKMDEVPSAQRAERHRTPLAGSGSLDTHADTVLGRGTSQLAEPGQATSSSTHRRRQLKRIYSDDLREDSLLQGPGNQLAAVLDEDEDLLEDLSFLRGGPIEAAAASSDCATLLGDASHSSAEAATLVKEPKLSFASRLSRATRSEQPASTCLNDDLVPDTEDPFSAEPRVEAHPDSDALAEQPDGATLLPRSQQSGSQPMSSSLHGSDGEPGSPGGDMDSQRTCGVGDEAKAAPSRRAFKRLCKANGASHERPAAGIRSLEDWTDDEDAEDDRRPPSARDAAEQQVEEARKGANPFARATKRQAQEPALAFHARPAVRAKAAANHLSTTDIRSVLLAPHASRQERPGGAQKVTTDAAACEDIIDLAADSSDDDETAARNTHAAVQRRPQQAKRKGVLQLPPHPASLGGGPAMLSRSTAMTPAGSGRQGAARKPGDRSYLGAYSAADIAEGRFPAAGSRPAAAEQPGAAAGLELPRQNHWQAIATADHYHDAYGGSNATYGQRDDRGKGKRKQQVADDYEDDYGGGYGDDRGVASGRWSGSGAEFGTDAGEEEWEEWRDPCDEAGPSYANPQRRRQAHAREQQWQQPAGGWDRDFGGAPSATAGRSVGPSGRGNGEPWWTRLEDFVPVEAMRGSRDPRDGSIVHIDYRAQFSGVAPPKQKSSRGASGGGGRVASGGADRGRERSEAPAAAGHWITEYQRHGSVKVYVTAAGKRLTGKAAYKASQKSNPSAPVPKEIEPKRPRKSSTWRSIKAKRKK